MADKKQYSDPNSQNIPNNSENDDIFGGSYDVFENSEILEPIKELSDNLEIEKQKHEEISNESFDNDFDEIKQDVKENTTEYSVDDSWNTVEDIGEKPTEDNFQKIDEIDENQGDFDFDQVSQDQNLQDEPKQEESVVGLEPEVKVDPSWESEEDKFKVDESWKIPQDTNLEPIQNDTTTQEDEQNDEIFDSEPEILDQEDTEIKQENDNKIEKIEPIEIIDPSWEEEKENFQTNDLGEIKEEDDEIIDTKKEDQEDVEIEESKDEDFEEEPEEQYQNLDEQETKPELQDQDTEEEEIEDEEIQDQDIEEEEKQEYSVQEESPEIYQDVTDLQKKFLELIRETKNIHELVNKDLSEGFDLLGGNDDRKKTMYKIFVGDEFVNIDRIETLKEDESEEIHTLSFVLEEKSLKVNIDDELLYDEIEDLIENPGKKMQVTEKLNKFIFLVTEEYKKIEKQKKEKEKRNQIKGVFRNF